MSRAKAILGCPFCGVPYREVEEPEAVVYVPHNPEECRDLLFAQLVSARADENRGPLHRLLDVHVGLVIKELAEASETLVRLMDEHIDYGAVHPYIVVSHNDAVKKAKERVESALDKCRASFRVVYPWEGFHGGIPDEEADHRGACQKGV